MSAGEVIWRGVDQLGTNDGRIALYLADNVEQLAPEATAVDGKLAAKIRALVATRGALFFDDIVGELGTFPADVLKALWELVWAGEITNDTLSPLRSLSRKNTGGRRGARARGGRPGFRTRRVLGPPGSEGRWSLLHGPASGAVSATTARAAQVQQLLDRYGVVTRESIAAEDIIGGFAGIYPVLKSMEEVGKVRRGYFVEGLGAAQFAFAGAEDRLRESRSGHAANSTLVLAATDPANVYGAAIRWPERPDKTGRPSRTAGARIVLVNGELVGWLGKNADQLLTWLPDDPAKHGAYIDALVQALVDRIAEPSIVINKIDGEPPGSSVLHAELLAAKFRPSGEGLMYRRGTASAMPRGRRKPRGSEPNA